LFLGGSLIQADAAETVDGAIEVIHALGGGFYNSGIVGQYFVPTSRLAAPGADNLRGRGYGSVTSLGLQYNLNISGLAPEAFGDHVFDAALFAMWNSVNIDIDQINQARAVSSLGPLTAEDERVDGQKRLKYGADLEYSPVKWFGAGLRYDRLQPNSKIPEQSFHIVSARLVFRSAFATHEEVTLGYSRYLYDQRDCPLTATPGSLEAQQCVQFPSGPVFPDGFGSYPGFTQSAAFRGAPTSVPHEQTFRVVATLWW
jgi:hypothetical protein